MSDSDETNEWVVKLHYSFQDEEFLYLVKHAPQSELRPKRTSRGHPALTTRAMPTHLAPSAGDAQRCRRMAQRPGCAALAPVTRRSVRCRGPMRSA